MRGLFGHLPGFPRCKLCNRPFTGPFGRPLAIVGFGPSRKNPSLCDWCFERLPLGGAQVDVAVLFVDLRGSTGMGERLSPTTFAATMNRFYALATEVLLAHGAVVDKLVGDEVVALFLPGLSGPAYRGLAARAGLGLVRAASEGTANDNYFPTKRELVLHSLRPDAFKRMCGDFMKESGHLQAEAPGRFLRAFVEFCVREVSFVRPAIHAALEIGAQEFWAAQEAGIATALDIMVAALRGAYPAATDDELVHLARAIRRTLMAALLDRSVGDEELREQLRALMVGDAILRRRHRDTAAAATGPVASAHVAVERKTTIRVV